MGAEGPVQMEGRGSCGQEELDAGLGSLEEAGKTQQNSGQVVGEEGIGTGPQGPHDCLTVRICLCVSPSHTQLLT